MGTANLTIWLTGCIVALILFLAAVVYLSSRVSKLERRYKQLMTGSEGKDLERMFLTRLGDIDCAKEDIILLERRCSALAHQLEGCVQRVGIVRFNAFDDTGSDLSYAIALLDDENNGVALSSIYGRSEARCYAKPVLSGQSNYMLTDEEKRAIKQAEEKSFKRKKGF